MPKRNGKDGCEVPFHWFAQTALTAGAYAIYLAPTILGGTRPAVEADSWAHFRVKRLKFRLHPMAVTGIGGTAAGIVGGVQDTLPASNAAIMELLPSTYIAAQAQVPSDWVTVRKEELAGPLPWYKAVPGAADPTEEAPGVFVASGTSTDYISVEFRGVYEFKTAVSTANTPAALKLRNEMRANRVKAHQLLDRARILAVLSPQIGVNTGAPTP